MQYFFYLSYQTDLLLQHNLTWHTWRRTSWQFSWYLIGYWGKTEVILNTHKDLQKMLIAMHYTYRNRGRKFLLPDACYTISTRGQDVLCKYCLILKSLMGIYWTSLVVSMFCSVTYHSWRLKMSYINVATTFISLMMFFTCENFLLKCGLVKQFLYAIIFERLSRKIFHNLEKNIAIITLCLLKSYLLHHFLMSWYTKPHI